MRRVDQELSNSGLPPLTRAAWVEVNISRLKRNAEALTDLCHPAAIAPVVKADGYGHGLEIAARCAVAGGANWLCVADAAEAIRLRSDGYEGRIFVLYPVPPQMWRAMAERSIDLTIASLAEASAMAAAEIDEGLRLHIEIDTGMTRGGVAPKDGLAVAEVIQATRSLRIAGVWTHLSTPEDPETIATQLERFDQIVDSIRRAGIGVPLRHASASGGLLASEPARHDLVRPGLAYYGLHPGAGSELPDGCVPALSVKACPVRIAKVPPGTRVGYAGTWTAARPSIIATLPIGYADGWARSSSPGTDAIVHGRRAPLVGRISSDSLTVDVTDVDGVDVNSEFTLLGSDGDQTITGDEVASVRRTISWEVLQQLGARLTRLYVADSGPVAIRPESSSEVVTSNRDSIPQF